MAKELSEIFEDLVQLKINYKTDDFAKKYLEVSRKINVNDYLEYTDDTRKDFSGIWHFVLNIKVSDKSDFVPFASALGTGENGNKAQSIADSFMLKNEIRYNFVDFVSDVATVLNNNKDVPRLSFSTCINKRGLFQIRDTRRFKSKIIGKQWFKPLKTDYTEEDFMSIIRRGGENHSFAKNLSLAYYNELGIRKLYFTIITLDSNYDSSGRLTQFMVITSKPKEASFFIDRTLEKIREIASFIRTRFVFDILKKSRMESVKSAKAAIMSRNMSHNLGSHVMAYLKQHLNSVQDMIRDNVLSQIIMPNEIGMDLSEWKERLEKTLETNIRELKEQKQKNGYLEQDSDSLIQVKEVALPFLVGLGKFISYLQERQDFIATIATAYAPYFSQVNFKDFIFDELNPDLRYERHSDRIGMKPDNILLGNIARSEGLARVTQPTKSRQEGISDIVLKYRTFDGHIPHGQQKKDLDVMRGINISLPGGVIGRQAIFSIVENIIRNAAKHGTWGKKNEDNPSLELTFNLYEKKDILQGTIPNNDAADKQYLGLLSFLKKYYLHTTDIDDLFIFTITDNMQFEANGADKWSMLRALNRAIIEPYIDDQGAMVNANKGIKEMRISAAWMRGLDDTDIEYPINSDGTYYKTLSWKKKHAPILLARPSRNANTQLSNLQYIVCLLKPKALAIITRENNLNKKLSDGRTLNEMLNDNACKILTKKEFLNAPNKSYDFIIFNDLMNDNGYSLQDYNEVRALSHNRIFKMSDKQVNEVLVKDVLAGNEKSFNLLIKDLYQKFAHYTEGEIIYIDDEKTDIKYNNELKGDYPQSYVHISKDFKHVYPYMYRTHHETELIFSRFMTDSDLSEIKKNLYVEGITGNNSTDRLVRNDIIDETWFYKHLRSMKTRVAIFDERIFSKVYRREEKELVQELFEQLPEKQIKLYLRSAASNDNTTFKFKDFRKITDIDNLIEYIRSNNISLIDGDFCGIQFDMKGVDVFTIIRRYNSQNKPDGLDIYGYYNYLAPDSKVGRNTYRSLIGRVGHIHMTSKKEVSIILYNTIYHNAFDYITIHQGLLDKVYEHFGIKKDSENKHQVTLRLYESFANTPSDYLTSTYYEKDGDTIIEKTGYFLPKLMVHSGRSKPSFVDMPQQQPFIQYSAIEHAALDCKYSLVELLDYARYEQE